MMDIGYIINIKNSLSNRSKKITVLSKNNGVFSSLIFNRKNLLSGSLIEFDSKTINNSSINFLDFEILKNSFYSIFFDRKNLKFFNSVVMLINKVFIYQTKIINVFKTFENLLFSFQEQNNLNTVYCYIDVIVKIIEYFGIKITFENYFNDDEKIYYISPKTGNCVSKTAGEKYRDKLFIIPENFLNFTLTNQSYCDMLKILKYFMRNIFIEYNLSIEKFESMFVYDYE